MRHSLLHTIGERHLGRSRGEHRPKPAQTPAVPAAGSNLDAAVQGQDIATRRVRAAGGPTDRASYACGCGYLFTASVTTTVECPHCGASQAW